MNIYLNIYESIMRALNIQINIQMYIYIEYLVEYSTFWIFIWWNNNSKTSEYSKYLWIFMIFKRVRPPDGKRGVSGAATLWLRSNDILFAPIFFAPKSWPKIRRAIMVSNILKLEELNERSKNVHSRSCSLEVRGSWQAWREGSHAWLKNYGRWPSGGMVL